MGVVWLGVGWALIVIWLPAAAVHASTTYDIAPGKRLDSNPLQETQVANICKCRSRCLTLRACRTWSAFVSSGGGDQLTCRLFPSAPQTYQLTDDPTAVTGYDNGDDEATTETPPTLIPAAAPIDIMTSITTTTPPTTTTSVTPQTTTTTTELTTTTTTTAPPTTTTTVPPQTTTTTVAPPTTTTTVTPQATTTKTALTTTTTTTVLPQTTTTTTAPPTTTTTSQATITTTKNPLTTAMKTVPPTKNSKTTPTTTSQATTTTTTAPPAPTTTSQTTTTTTTAPSITTTTAPPTTTTTTTSQATTTAPPTTSTLATTTTTAAKNYDSKITTKGRCSHPYLVTGIALEIKDEKESHIKWLECTKPSSDSAAESFGLKSESMVRKSMGPSPVSAQCPSNTMIRGIRGFKEYTKGDYGEQEYILKNSKYMFAVCQEVTNWVVSFGDCLTVDLYSGVAGAWPGLDSPINGTDQWDHWLRCPSEGYMAVKVTRVEGREKQRKPLTMKCCRLSPP